MQLLDVLCSPELQQKHVILSSFFYFFISYYIRRTLFVFAQWPNMHVSPFSFSAVLLTEKRAKIRPSLKFVYVVGVVRCLAEIK